MIPPSPMNKNLVLRYFREILNYQDEDFVKMLTLMDVKVTFEELSSWLKAEGEGGYVELSDKMLAFFLESLILLKRGKGDDTEARPLELPVTNNLVLKKLRIAFELKEDDIVNVMAKSAQSASPKEWSPYFRSKKHKHFRKCPDAFLEAFLKGLVP